MVATFLTALYRVLKHEVQLQILAYSNTNLVTIVI